MQNAQRIQHARTSLRRQMPVAEKWAYFDHAAVAPLPAAAAEAMQTWCGEAAGEGDTIWGQWNKRIEAVRRRAAELAGAEAEEIALVPNTTAGVNIVAEGYPWQAGDNVVTAANEFPTNLYPWLNLHDRGVEVRRVEPQAAGEIDPQQIADACDERTRIVSLSWVGYGSGWRIDPAEMASVAQDHGALFFLDAIQGFGVFPLDVGAAGVDFFAADGHKWMLGPEGAGLLFVKREHLDRLRPVGVGWNSVVHHYDYSHIELKLRPTAARYEGGSQNMVGFHGLGASLDVLADCGLAAGQSVVAECVLDITATLMQRLEQIGATLVSPRDDANRSGIVSFQLPDRDPPAVRAHCLKSGVALACRDGRLRVSPHAYNNEDDVERLIAALGDAT